MKTTKKYTLSLTLLLAILLSVAVVPATAKKRDNSAENSRKAEYIYMEALRQNALNNTDSYFELLNRAYQLDPNNSDVGFFLGYYQMVLAKNDTIMPAKGYKLMKDHFDKAPEDFYATYFFGNLNEKIRNYRAALKVWATLDSIYPEKSEIAMKHAESLAASGDSANIAKALDIFSRVEVAEGKSVNISARKMNAMLMLRDTTSIFAELHQLLESSPTSSEFRTFAGDVYAMFERNDSARYYYDTACQLDSANGLVYYSRANFFLSQGDSIAYDREVFRALKQENLDLGTKLQLLTSYIKALYDDPTQHGRIQDLFAELIEQHPHEVDIHDLYSAYFAAIKDYASAAEQSKYAVDIDPSDESRWRSLMSMHGMCDNYDMAIAEGHNALNYHPKSLALTYYLAINYSMAEMTDSALVYYDKALALIEPNNSSARSDIYCSIGDTYYKANSADSAYVYYEKAIEANPGNLLALNNCAYHMACENRDLEKAERMSAMTVREEPQNSSSLDTYAWVLFKLKRYNDAKYYIDEAFKYDEEPSSELYHHAGDIYFFATGEAEQSLPFWQKALELEPDNELLQRKVKHQTYFSR